MTTSKRNAPLASPSAASTAPTAPAPAAVRWIAFALVTAAALYAGIYAARPVTTLDFWWHLRTGEEILATHSIPATDPFSHTAGGRPWVNHEWLFDVLLALAWSKAGATAVRAFFGILASATVLLVAWIARRWTRSESLAAVLSVAFVGLFFTVLQVRPQAISYPLCLVFFEVFLFRADPKGRIRAGHYAAWAAILILWANFHAVSLLPLIFYAVSIAAGAVAASGRIPFLAEPPRDRLPWRAHVPFFLVLLGCTFLNANTWRMHQLAFQGSALSASFISEWAPFHPRYGDNLNLPFATYACVIAMLAIVAASLAAHAIRRVRLDAAGTAVALATAAAVLSGRRWLWLTIVPVLISLQDGSPLRRALAEILPAPSPTGKRKDGAPVPAGSGRRAAALAATLIACLFFARPLAEIPIAVLVGRSLADGTYFTRDTSADQVPEDAAIVMKEAGLTGNLFNHYGWGGYLIHELYPRCRVFWDGRAIVFGDRIVGDALAIWSKKPEAAALLGEYGVALTVMPETWAPPERKPGEWIPFFRNTSSAIYGRYDDNLPRIDAYYASLGIPFDGAEGFIAGAAVEANEGWARNRHVIDDALMETVAPLYAGLRAVPAGAPREAAPYRLKIAEGFMRAGLADSAARELRLAHEAVPDDRAALLNLANVEIQRRRGAVARALLLNHLALHPGDAEAEGLLDRARLIP